MDQFPNYHPHDLIAGLVKNTNTINIFIFGYRAVKESYGMTLKAFLDIHATNATKPMSACNDAKQNLNHLFY
ncbi:hypothetical protein RCA_03000 [Rickettsia canadensis str. CA410]|uniref:Uncharacterized protein n=1 Tax=Rickettsia canadensis str. CA410 TaxID=1105107 RepID=A0ABN4ACJ1_RICCA|nr:hypothetical protein RCA_03000 [Rickettsia canadensis str. CA410]